MERQVNELLSTYSTISAALKNSIFDEVLKSITQAFAEVLTH
jgi:hypothetical protein